jgi:uncharacterized protein YjbJ (UPF0337 family)
MRGSHLLLAGIGVGAIFTYLLFYEPTLQHETEFDSVEDAANEAWRWGTKKRFGGGVDNLVGSFKENVGRATGNDDLAAEGVLDQAAGTFKDVAGAFGRAAGETIHDLNR